MNAPSFLLWGHNAVIAQLEEQFPCKESVAGSTPAYGFLDNQNEKWKLRGVI